MFECSPRSDLHETIFRIPATLDTFQVRMQCGWRNGSEGSIEHDYNEQFLSLNLEIITSVSICQLDQIAANSYSAVHPRSMNDTYKYGVCAAYSLILSIHIITNQIILFFLSWSAGRSQGQSTSGL